MCNNLGEPMWGAVGAKMRRLLTSQYSDISGAPRGGLVSTNEECVTGGIDGRECFSRGGRRIPNPR